MNTPMTYASSIGSEMQTHVVSSSEDERCEHSDDVCAVTSSINSETQTQVVSSSEDARCEHSDDVCAMASLING